MVFTPSGSEALGLVERQAFDVLVSGLRTSDLDGVILLNKVGQGHPHILRFIRSSYADKELIMNCVWGTHQFIPLPCEGPALISVIRRALSLNDCLANAEIKALISRMTNFPSLPTLYFEVMRKLESPSVEVSEIAAIITKDLAMTTKLLQMVNSAFFGFQRKISTVSDAITILGMETVKSVVFSIHVFSHYEKSNALKRSLDKLWGHSMAVATAAKRITFAQTQDTKLADETFTAGLLHDIGKLVLTANLAEQYGEVTRRACEEKSPLWQIERERLGATHGEVGAYLLGLWSMPISLRETAALHHCPAGCADEIFSPLTAVHVANVFEHERNPDKQGFAPPSLDEDYLRGLGLAEEIDGWRTAAYGDAGDKPASPVPAPAQRKSAKPASAPQPAPPVSPARQAAPAVRRAKISYRRRVGVTIAIGTMLIVGALVLLWAAVGRRDASVHARHKPYHSPVTNPPREVPPKPATQPAADGEMPVSPTPVEPEAEFPAIEVQAIFSESEDPTARLNGTVLGKGDEILGAKVVEISATTVTLSFRGVTKSFSLQ